MDDSLALEYDDALDLRFTSFLPGLIEGFEDATPPQFIRNSIHVNIVDTDGESLKNLEHCHSCIYKFTSEGSATGMKFHTPFIEISVETLKSGIVRSP